MINTKATDNNKLDLTNLNQVLKDVENTEVIDLTETNEDLTDNELQILELQESLSNELSNDSLGLIDRVINIQEFCTVSGLDNLVYYVKGKASDRLFSDSSYGIIGQVTIHNCDTSEDLVLGVLLNDAFSLYSESRDHLRRIGYTVKQIESIVSEVNKKYCIATKVKAEIVKQNKKQEALRIAKQLVELRDNKAANTVKKPNIRKFSF